MLSKMSQKMSNDTNEICNFYAGKSIFITGTSGFLGSVLLETLLRCCPGITRIYILLRSKKGCLAEERKNSIFNKDIFCKLKATNPEALKKVIVLSGDISEDKLGLNEKDYNTLIKSVSVVFHVAATVSFLKPLSFTVRQNVISTNNIVDLCRKLENLEALVYTSSVYSSCNQKDIIEEKIYDLQFSADEVIKFGRDNNEDELVRLYHMCNPPFPNFYTFSKCVSENLLKEKAHDLPVCIIRPSIIFTCLRGPLPGYIEERSAIVQLIQGVGKGFIRVIQVDKNKRIEIIPADVTANAHIIGAYCQATQNLTSPSVYNCVSTELADITWSDFVKKLLVLNNRNPMKQCYVYSLAVCCRNQIIYSFLSLLLHYIPGAIIDILLRISGNSLSVVKMYKFYGKSMNSVSFFTTNEWNMLNKNFQSLSKSLNEVEQKIFSMDLKDFTMDEITRIFPTGAPLYRQNGKLYREKLHLKCLRYFLFILYIWFILGSTASILYLILSTVLKKKSAFKMIFKLR